MSKDLVSGRALAVIAMVVAVATGIYTAREAHRARLQEAAYADELAEMNTAMDQQQAAIAVARQDLEELQQQLTDATSRSELEKLTEELRAISAKTLRLESITKRLEPIQEQLSSLTPETLGHLNDLGDALKRLDGGAALTNLLASVTQMQSRVGSLGRQNEDLVRYVEQRIRALRNANTRTDPEAEPQEASNTGDYRVHAGDTLEGIAKKLGVSLHTILEANPSVDAKRLQIGQSIDVPDE